MAKRLSEFAVGESGTILSVSGEGAVRRRLFDMGVTPGAEIKLVKVAPLGDPLCVLLRGYELSVRKDEAAEVVMEVKK